MKIQICLTVLAVVCFALSVYCAKKDYGKTCTASFVLFVCFAVLSMWRLQCFVGGGYLYGNVEANTVANSLFIYRDDGFLGNKMHLDKFVSRYIINEEFKDLNSLDRVEFYLKGDLSGANFFDILLCRNDNKENTENNLFDGVLRKGLPKEDSYMLVYDTLGIGGVELGGKPEEYYKMCMLSKLGG